VTHDQLWRDVGQHLTEERTKIQGVKFTLHFIPPAGGEAEFSARILEAQRLPVVGEYVHLRQEGMTGAAYFRVVLVGTTYKESASKRGDYTEETIGVLAEYIEGPEGYMSDEHRNAVDAYKRRGLPVHREPPWGY